MAHYSPPVAAVGSLAAFKPSGTGRPCRAVGEIRVTDAKVPYIRHPQVCSHGRLRKVYATGASPARAMLRRTYYIPVEGRSHLHFYNEIVFLVVPRTTLVNLFLVSPVTSVDRGTRKETLHIY